jgi:hypothetical protein
MTMTEAATPHDPVEALGALVANYLSSMGVSTIMLEMSDDDAPVLFDLGEAMDATNVLPVLTAAAEQIYRGAGMDAAAATWPIALVAHRRATLGVQAKWDVRPGAAIWGAVYPCVMEAAHELFQRVEDEPEAVVLKREILVALEAALRPGA